MNQMRQERKAIKKLKKDAADVLYFTNMMQSIGAKLDATEDRLIGTREFLEPPSFGQRLGYALDKLRGKWPTEPIGRRKSETYILMLASPSDWITLSRYLDEGDDATVTVEIPYKSFLGPVNITPEDRK